MLSIEEQIISASDLSAYTENRYGHPARDAFVTFLADCIRKDSPEEISVTSVVISRDTKHAFNITGSVVVTDRAKQIEGYILWLPKLGCFRGHIIVDPKGRVNQMLIDDANFVRSLPWRNTKWYGKDHDHCRLCMAILCEHPSDAAFDSGYTVENAGWLCPDCYDNVVIGGGDHPWLEPT